MPEYLTETRFWYRKQSTAESGDIVVALMEDGATVKTFYKEKGYYRLQPENDTMDPILIHEGSGDPRQGVWSVQTLQIRLFYL